LRQLLARHGFLEYLEVLVFSDEVGVAKPQRPMFDAAAKRLHVATSDLLHIGDLEVTDIAGAKGVGAQAALFTGINASNLNDTQADHTFTSWTEFIDALPGIVG
jgi:FMN phosphatase YigB (HAD superfamily)